MTIADKIAYVAEYTVAFEDRYVKDGDQVDHFFRKLNKEEKRRVNEKRRPEDTRFSRNQANFAKKIYKSLGLQLK